MNNESIKRLSKILNHSSIEVTKRYIGLYDIDGSEECNSAEETEKENDND